MGGSNFVVVNPATQGFTAEATAAIVAQIATQIEAKFADFMGAEGQKLLNTLPSILQEVATLKGQVATLTCQLNASMPEIGDAQAKLDENLHNLVKRDQEVSDKLKASFADVDARLAEVVFKSRRPACC